MRSLWIRYFKKLSKNWSQSQFVANKSSYFAFHEWKEINMRDVWGIRSFRWPLVASAICLYFLSNISKLISSLTFQGQKSELAPSGGKCQVATVTRSHSVVPGYNTGTHLLAVFVTPSVIGCVSRSKVAHHRAMPVAWWEASLALNEPGPEEGWCDKKTETKACVQGEHSL